MLDSPLRIIYQAGERIFASVSITSHEVAPSLMEPFACLLWSHTGGSSVDWQRGVARVLIICGCRYAVCAGTDCESWHDAFDEAFALMFSAVPESVREANLIMTTWHADETPDDVAFSFINCTDFGPYRFSRYLVAHVGGSESSRAELDETVRAHVTGAV